MNSKFTIQYMRKLCRQLSITVVKVYGGEEFTASRDRHCIDIRNITFLSAYNVTMIFANKQLKYFSVVH